MLLSRGSEHAYHSCRKGTVVVASAARVGTPKMRILVLEVNMSVKLSSRKVLMQVPPMSTSG